MQEHSSQLNIYKENKEKQKITSKLHWFEIILEKYLRNLKIEKKKKKKRKKEKERPWFVADCVNANSNWLVFVPRHFFNLRQNLRGKQKGFLELEMEVYN